MDNKFPGWLKWFIIVFLILVDVLKWVEIIDAKNFFFTLMEFFLIIFLIKILIKKIDSSNLSSPIKIILIILLVIVGLILAGLSVAFSGFSDSGIQ